MFFPKPYVLAWVMCEEAPYLLGKMPEHQLKLVALP
jgi:hypothetical protein